MEVLVAKTVDSKRRSPPQNRQKKNEVIEATGLVFLAE